MGRLVYLVSGQVLLLSKIASERGIVINLLVDHGLGLFGFLNAWLWSGRVFLVVFDTHVASNFLYKSFISLAFLRAHFDDRMALISLTLLVRLWRTVVSFLLLHLVLVLILGVWPRIDDRLLHDKLARVFPCKVGTVLRQILELMLFRCSVLVRPHDLRFA